MIRYLTYYKEIATGIVVTVKATETGAMVYSTRDEAGGWDCDQVEIDEATLSVFGTEIDLDESKADQAAIIEDVMATSPIRDVLTEADYEEAA